MAVAVSGYGEGSDAGQRDCARRPFLSRRPAAGCPIDRGQLLNTLAALRIGRKPRLPAKTVRTECKMRAVTCVLVADGTPGLGPVTHAGCGALRPRRNRGCYGCFGPPTVPQTATLIPLLRRDGMPDDSVDRVFSTFNVSSFGAAFTEHRNTPRTRRPARSASAR